MSDSWIQILSVFLANAGLIIWFRTEARSDWRHMDAKLDATLSGIREEMNAIHEEVKDFHGRLCAIEEKNKSNNHRK